jgi:hypothetical protein
MSTITVRPNALIRLDAADNRSIQFNYDDDNLAAGVAITTSTFRLIPIGATAKRLLSITRTTTTATATTGAYNETGTLVAAAHGLSTGQYVTVAGADQTDYNLTAQITVTGATTFTYTVANSPTTPATGTLVYGGPSPILDNASLTDTNRNTTVRVDARTSVVGGWYELANTIVTNETPAQTKEHAVQILVQG